MRHRCWFCMVLLVLFVFVSSPSIRAAESSPGESVETDFSQQLELPRLIQHAYENNPQMRVARSEWQAAIAKLPQITSLPDPMVMAGYYLRSVETRVGPQHARASISQSFPYPGTLDAAGQVMLKQIEILAKKHDQVVRDVIVQVKLSYHELAYLERAIDITTQNQGILDHIVTLAATRYAEDAATFSDLLKAQSQRAQLDYDLVLLRELREVEYASIRSLLNLEPDTPLGTPAPLSYQPTELAFDELYQKALVQRQEIQVADLMVEKAGKAIELAEMKNKPMFKLDLMTIETGEALMLGTQESGKNPWTISLGVSIPLWGAKNQSRIQEAEQNRQTAIEKKESMETQLIAPLRKVLFKLDNARRLVELYEDTLIPQAEKAIENTEAWHQDENPKSLAGLLETQSVWHNFSLARARAVTDYQQNLVRLEQLVGGSLEGE